MLGIFISFLLATSASAIWPKPRLVQKLDTLGEGKLVTSEEFPAMHIPFGAKVLFWNNPKRAGCDTM